EVINQAVAFVNQLTGDEPRFGGTLASYDVDVLAKILPTIRGAVSSERAKVLTVDTSPRAVEFVSSVQAEQLVTVGAPCPDHLVHTKRLPLWIPWNEDVDALKASIVSRADEYRAAYRSYFASFAGEGDVPADPDARIVLVQGVGIVSVGTTTKLSKVS